MAYSTSFKENAARLRQEGYSIKEISQKLKISKATSSTWLRNVKLNSKALERLSKRRILGQYKTSLILQKKTIQKEKIAKDKAISLYKNTHISDNHLKILCSFLFWAEGAKNFGQIKFINSDPKMIVLFVKLLRSSFLIDESKFRVLVHLHEYHNKKAIEKYWSEKTNIPLSQFQKSYLKPNTGKRKRKNYKGCISVNYYDAVLARELHAIYNTFAEELIGV